jgi:hypothetical protein
MTTIPDDNQGDNPDDSQDGSPDDSPDESLNDNLTDNKGQISRLSSIGLLSVGVVVIWVVIWNCCQWCCLILDIGFLFKPSPKKILKSTVHVLYLLNPTGLEFRGCL